VCVVPVGSYWRLLSTTWKASSLLDGWLVLGVRAQCLVASVRRWSAWRHSTTSARRRAASSTALTSPARCSTIGRESTCPASVNKPSTRWTSTANVTTTWSSHVSQPCRRHFALQPTHDDSSRGVVGRGRGATASPTLFSTGGTRPPLPPPLFWTEIRAKVSPLLQLVTYWNAL